MKPTCASLFLVAFFLGVGASDAQEKPLSAVQKTEHFEIHYRPGSRAGASVDRIAVLAERELERICSQLGISVGGSFSLHLYDDVKDLGETTGMKHTGGFSAGNASHLPYDNDQTRYHEMVHVVAHNLLPKGGSKKRNLFFAEGLANACLEFVHGVPVHAVARFYKDQGCLPALKEMTGTEDFYAWLRLRRGFNAYDVGGSYFRFLLDEFGARRTTRYYTGAAAKKALGASEQELEKRWHKLLGQFKLRPEVAQLLEKRHGESVRVLEGLQKPAKLPPYILGRKQEWKSLMKAALVSKGPAKWVRQGGSITGSSDQAVWSVCELGSQKFGDCAVRCTIRTEKPSPIQVRLGDGNQGMLVNGTFLYRGDKPVGHSPAAEMNALRKTTDFVLYRKKGQIEIWIDGRNALTAPADATPAPVGIAIHQGRVVFEDVRVRTLDQGSE